MVSSPAPQPNPNDALKAASLAGEIGSERRGDQWLRFFLEPNATALLLVTQMVEVLNIPIGSIVRIPDMPPWVMGVYNWRGEVLWVFDLGHLTGLTPWYQQETSASTYATIVLNVGGRTVGVVVKRVEDIELFDLADLRSPPASAVSPEMAPYLRGYWLTEAGDMLMAIDGEAILSKTAQITA
ncbi:MAG: chemotaxis protein CheW [Cyanobacteria bacterium J06642_2]